MTLALSLTQPWASLVAQGTKAVETRSWSTRYRGPLLIHASKGWTAADRRWTMALHRRGILPLDLALGQPVLPLGMIVARVALVDVVPTENLQGLSATERMLGDYAPGRFAWLLQLLEAFAEPIPARGMLGLWEGPDL